jgi:hypothetical protein
MENQIQNLLREGDLRSIGRVAEVIELVLDNNQLFESLVLGMAADEPGVRMRACDAVEKISRQHPHYLRPHKDFILNQISGISQQEVQWHIAQIIPRLELSDQEIKQANEVLLGYLDSTSKIVQTNALTALVELNNTDPIMIRRIMSILKHYVESGSPAVKNRAEKLLSKLVR